MLLHTRCFGERSSLVLFPFVHPPLLLLLLRFTIYLPLQTMEEEEEEELLPLEQRFLGRKERHIRGKVVGKGRREEKEGSGTDPSFPLSLSLLLLRRRRRRNIRRTREEGPFGFFPLPSWRRRRRRRRRHRCSHGASSLPLLPRSTLALCRQDFFKRPKGKKFKGGKGGKNGRRTGGGRRRTAAAAKTLKFRFRTVSRSSVLGEGYSSSSFFLHTQFNFFEFLQASKGKKYKVTFLVGIRVEST